MLTPTPTATLSPYGAIQGIIFHDVNQDGIYTLGTDLPLHNGAPNSTIWRVH